MNEQIETLIIGGGQGGLVTSYYLTQQGREHIILDAAEAPAQAWRHDRWDSFTLVTPNWSFRMPGGEYDGPNPGGFMPKAEVVSRLEGYIQKHRLPVRYGVRATSVELEPYGYRVTTSNGAGDSATWDTRNVVIATGLFQKARTPPWGKDLPAGILQVASGQYRNPDSLPPGAVLVAGSAQSGCQIAEELLEAGRKVYLCTGSAGRAPRRYRGKDIFEWLHLSGYIARTTEQLRSPQERFSGNPQISGKNGGHSLNLHQFYRDGMVLLGRLQRVSDGVLHLGGDLKANLEKSDALEATIVQGIDTYIQKEGMDAPEEMLPALTDGYSAEEITTLDLKQAGITSVIWALGYTFDFSLVKLPVFDEFGFPQTVKGVTIFPGLCFAGLPWLPGQDTGIFLSVGATAAAVAEHIDSQR